MRDDRPLRERIVLSRWFWVLVLAILGFVIYSLIRIAERRYTINAMIDEKRTTISRLSEENQSLSSLLAYYKSEYYEDQVARREMGLQRPGEEVIAAPDNVDKVTRNDTVSVESVTTEANKEKREMSNPEKWLRFLMGNL